MRTLSPAFAAHLATRTTTLAACWRVSRADGSRLGFTDHDRPLAFDGTDFLPESGLTASDAVGHAGLQVGGLEVEGALAADALSEDDLLAGLYDGARVEMWLVNWQAPEERHLVRVGTIGEVRREGAAFVAELRGLAHALDGEGGRTFAFTCDADLGDARCRVNLALPDWRAEGVVSATDGRSTVRAEALGGRPDGLFDRGLLAFASGACAGLRVEIGRHRAGEDHGVLELWEAMPRPIEPGDAFVATASCDKRFLTCRDRFDNSLNFRGFPHMPGNNFALSYARRGGARGGRPVAS